MVRPFSHSIASPVVFGAGAAATVGEKTLAKKWRRIAILTDRTVRALPFFDVIVASCGDRVAFVDDGAVADADVVHVDAVAARAREGGAIDGIIAVGGGSVIDTAKGVGIGVVKGKSVVELEGLYTIRTPIVPIIAIPTTAGTGSEATQFCVLKDHAHHTKRIFTDQHLVPTLAVLDPTLTTGLPRGVSCATAVDAVTHAVEALASKMQNPIATALATEALRLHLIERALDRALENGADLDARGDALMAANLAGQAVTSAMLGACHAFAHVVGAHAGVAHGVANGLFLVAVMKENLPKAAPAYARAARALGLPSAGDDAAAFVSVVDGFVHGTAGVPRRLRDVAPQLEGELERLAKDVVKDPDLATNPVPVDEAAALRVLRAVF
jgi:alcohol dehydrogenase class IV